MQRLVGGTHRLNTNAASKVYITHKETNIHETDLLGK